MYLVQYKNIINMIYCVKFKVLIVMSLKNQFFWVVVLFCLVSSSSWTS
jgi:hypothetical protein